MQTRVRFASCVAERVFVYSTRTYVRFVTELDVRGAAHHPRRTGHEGTRQETAGGEDGTHTGHRGPEPGSDHSRDLKDGPAPGRASRGLPYRADLLDDGTRCLHRHRGRTPSGRRPRSIDDVHLHRGARVVRRHTVVDRGRPQTPWGHHRTDGSHHRAGQCTLWHRPSRRRGHRRPVTGDSWIGICAGHGRVERPVGEFWHLVSGPATRRNPLHVLASAHCSPIYGVLALREANM